jgi:hypothetical protein
VVLHIADQPGYPHEITVPGAPADQYGFLDFDYQPPCLYRRDAPRRLNGRSVRATGAAGWTVFPDELTAESFACDAPPDAAQGQKPAGN